MAWLASWVFRLCLNQSTEDRSSVRCGGRLFQSRGAELEKARAANAEVVIAMNIISAVSQRPRIFSYVQLDLSSYSAHLCHDHDRLGLLWTTVKHRRQGGWYTDQRSNSQGHATCWKRKCHKSVKKPTSTSNLVIISFVGNDCASTSLNCIT